MTRLVWLVRANLSADEVDGDVALAGSNSGIEVIDEAGLRTGVGLNDVVTEFIRVVGDAVVDGVILPITIEDGLGVDTGAVERELRELVDIDPARDVLVRLQQDSQKANAGTCAKCEGIYLELADVEDLQVGAVLEDRDEHRAISTAVDERVVDVVEARVLLVDLVDDVQVFLGALPILSVPLQQVLPCPVIPVLRNLQAIRHQAQSLHLQMQRPRRKHMEHT